MIFSYSLQKVKNYGHVIFEALAGGCIPIISDQTPWNDIEKIWMWESNPPLPGKIY